MKPASKITKLRARSSRRSGASIWPKGPSSSSPAAKFSPAPSALWCFHSTKNFSGVPVVP
ncbi:hypothetical protein FQZ97_1216850 [compost metagenome]